MSDLVELKNMLIETTGKLAAEQEKTHALREALKGLVGCHDVPASHKSVDDWDILRGAIATARKLLSDA